MNAPRKQIIRVGTIVRLKDSRFKTKARVERKLSDVKGGVVLDKYINGFRCWNIKHLKRAD
jgi:hypothetical protein